MKKTIGIFAVITLFLMLASGCNKLGDENITDSAEPNPTISEEEITSTSEEKVTDNTTSNVTENAFTSPSETENIQTEDIEDNISDAVNQITQTAEALLGIPFVMNGASPDVGFDNPGFIYYVLRENGFITCPRLIADQASMGTHTDYYSLKKGDLVFFSNDNSGQADFGGIFIGNGQMIYCPMPGEVVQIADISSEYWRTAFYAGVRLS